MERNERDYIECDVTILTNPAKEKLNSPVILYTLLISVTLSHEVFSIAIQNIDLRSRNIDYKGDQSALYKTRDLTTCYGRKIRGT